jgi:YesN/AraC family two-component response regulator
MLKVFIADDSDLIRQHLKELISEVAGVQVVGEARNGPATLAAVERLEPDVLILDIRMPGGNGISVLKAVKELDPSPVVIMLTAFPFPQYRKRCLGAGAEYFLDKGSEFERVADVLAGLRHHKSEG